ncbi:mucoidy inhibitor MuiA family protein [Shimia sp. NS0008-38b]|uniref:mucoidy inhibitor MuiA family protein n=1 Tax=Shimia sp. NS0008-38b TaxID=3127653 RepID=UPI003102E4C3
MKHVLFAAALTPLTSPLWADTILVNAPVTAATLYSEGATVTRSVPFSAPEGSHEILITNLPESLDPLSVRVTLDGANLGTVAVRESRTLPHLTEDSVDLKTAKSLLEEAEATLASTQDARDDVLMQAEAARARMTYLATLKGPSDTAASPETLSATLALIGKETLAAQREAATAEREARRFDKALEEQTEAVKEAQQTVDALTPSQSDNAMLAIAMTASADTDATLTLTHLADDVEWVPVYDIHLDNLDDPSLRMKRGAFLYQDTGEDWDNVAITLSTSRPDEQNTPATLYPRRHYIYKPEPQPKMQLDRSYVASEMGAMADPVVEPVLIEESADFGMGLDGLTATYTYDKSVSLTSGSDYLRIALDTLDLSPKIYAMANPLHDDTAFLMAEATNTSGEMILPGFVSNAYLNGTFVGEIDLPLISKGAEMDLPFGAIDGLRLTDVVTDRITGDTGVITTRNERSETRVFTAENLTDRAWDLRLIGQVPYSEQEDLVITHQAQPAATDTNYDDKRGVLMWQTPLNAGASFDVTLSHKLQWPTDMELR